ncbi:ATP-grasp fold amidoligase family protein, partial [Staphylococcus sp. GDX8P106P-2]
MLNKLKIAVRKLLLRESTKGFYKKVRHLKIMILQILNDEQYVKLNIKLNANIKLNLENPKMHVEKINWLKLNYKNPLQTEYTDKYKMRNHLIEHNYGHILPPLIGVYDSFNKINLDELPNKVFLKTTHTSGINQVLEKDITDIGKTAKKFNNALKQNYYKFSREWNYKNIDPQILVEEYLDMTQYLDYKFYVFNGKVEFFAVIKGINDDKGNQSLSNRINLYDTKLNRLKIDIKRKGFDDSNFEFSQFIEEMISISEDLASPFPFCRV